MIAMLTVPLRGRTMCADALVRLVREGAAQVWAECVTKYAGSPPSAATRTDARMVAACVACLAATLDVGRLPRESEPIAASVLPTTAVQHAMASLVHLAQTPHSDAATGALRHHWYVVASCRRPPRVSPGRVWSHPRPATLVLF